MNDNPSDRIHPKRALAKARLKALYAQILALAGSILFLGLACGIGAIVFFAWLAEEVFEGDTQTFDETVRNFVHGFTNDQLTLLMQIITFLGSTLFLSLVYLCILAVFIKKKWNRAAVLMTTTMAGAIILNFFIKVSFQRARPVPFFDTPLPSSYSFPSGHAIFAACFYVGLAWLFTSRINAGAVRILIWILAVFFSLLIGLSRIYLGVHYPSDVIAGFTAAFVWLSTVVTIDYTIKKFYKSINAENS